MASPIPYVHGMGATVQTTSMTKVTECLAVSPDEAAQLLGVSRDTFDRHVRDRVAYVLIGTRTVIPVVELERYLARHAT
jgi:excisionase family DNA binding protein